MMQRLASGLGKTSQRTKASMELFDEYHGMYHSFRFKGIRNKPINTAVFYLPFISPASYRRDSRIDPESRLSCHRRGGTCVQKVALHGLRQGPRNNKYLPSQPSQMNPWAGHLMSKHEFNPVSSVEKQIYDCTYRSKRHFTL